MGAIVWRLWLLDIAVSLIGAWLISYRKNIVVNSIGFIFFLLKSGYWFSRFLIKSMRTSHLWIYEVYIGSFILFLGIISYVYSLVITDKLKRNINRIEFRSLIFLRTLKLKRV